MLIQKTYKNLNVAGFEPAPPGRFPGIGEKLRTEYLSTKISPPTVLMRDKA